MATDSDFPTAPSVLYKYRRFDQEGRHLRLITHGELSFASAASFNDPFDTSFRYNFDGLDGELGELWARDAASRLEPDKSPEEREEYARQRIAEIRRDPGEVDRMHNYVIESNYKAWGICSLCSSNNNLLLWAQYAQDHRGFCVGLSMDHLDAISQALVPEKLVLDLLKVRYTPDVPNPNFFDKMIHLEDTSYILDFIRTKSPDWSYEEEYRLIFWDRANSVLSLPPEAIVEVIFGCRISPIHKLALLNACRSRLPHAALFQAKKSESHFAITLEPIER